MSKSTSNPKQEAVIEVSNLTKVYNEGAIKARVIWASASSKAIFSFAPFTQKLGERFSKMTHKRGRRSAKSEDIRSQWQDARKFQQTLVCK